METGQPAEMGPAGAVITPLSHEDNEEQSRFLIPELLTLPERFLVPESAQAGSAWGSRSSPQPLLPAVLRDCQGMGEHGGRRVPAAACDREPGGAGWVPRGPWGTRVEGGGVKAPQRWPPSPSCACLRASLFRRAVPAVGPTCHQRGRRGQSLM